MLIEAERGIGVESSARPAQCNRFSWSTHAGQGGRFEGGQHRLDLLTLLILTFDLHHVQLVFGGCIDTGLRGGEERTSRTLDGRLFALAFGLQGNFSGIVHSPSHPFRHFMLTIYVT